MSTTVVHSDTPRYRRLSRSSRIATSPLPLFAIWLAPAAALGPMDQGSRAGWSTPPPPLTDWWFLAFVLGALALLISLTILVVWFVKLRPHDHRPLPCPIPGEVVHQAAEILEREIAAGVVAAKEVEERLAASKVLTAGDKITPMQLSGDLYDALNTVAKSVSSATRSLDDVARRMDTAAGRLGRERRILSRFRGAAQDQHVFRDADGNVPVVTIPNTIRAGEETAFTLDLENNLEEPTGGFAFVSSSLVSASGEQIPADEIRFEPGAVDIGPYQTQKVTLTVHVPLGKPEGTYVGLIQTTKPGQFQAVLAIRVA